MDTHGRAVLSASNINVFVSQHTPRAIDVRTEWIAAFRARSWIRVVRNSFNSRRSCMECRSNLDLCARGRCEHERGVVRVERLGLRWCLEVTTATNFARTVGTLMAALCAPRVKCCAANAEHQRCSLAFQAAGLQIPSPARVWPARSKERVAEKASRRAQSRSC